MSYAVKEIFFSLQGEGVNSGMPAVFCRFTGCNLWNGREADRATARCRFCDTDFVGTDGHGGGHYGDQRALVSAIRSRWPRSEAAPLIVFTGGEPGLQLDRPLIDAAHAAGMQCAVETNGTRPLPEGLDWICVSPKAGCDLVVRHGDELKVVFPQDGLDLTALRCLQFNHFLLSPMDGPDQEHNVALAAAYCMSDPRWRLTLQIHKIVGLP